MNIKMMVPFFMVLVSSAMAINIQNVKYETDFKAKAKSVGILKSNIEKDSLIKADKKEELMSELNLLEEMSQELLAIDESCLSTKSKQMLDDECEEYFDELLPSFKQKLKAATVAYKLENLYALKESGDKRAFVKQCVENILATDFSLSNYYSGTDLKIEEEIDDDGYRVNYNLSVFSQKKNSMDVWLEGISDLCLNDIADKKSLSGNNALRWSGAYLTDFSYKLIDKEETKKNEKSKKWDIYLDQSDLAIACYDRLDQFKASLKGNSNSMNFCNSFGGYLDEKSCNELNRLTKICASVDLKRRVYGEKDEGQSYGARLYVVNKSAVGFKYVLNGKPILSCQADSGAVLDVIYIPTYQDIVNKQSEKYNYSKQYFKIARMSNLASYGNRIPAYLSCDCAGHLEKGICKGLIFVSDDELKKGMTGVLTWENGKNMKSADGKKKAGLSACDDPNLSPKDRKKCKMKMGK